MTDLEPGTVVDGSNYPMLKLPGDQFNIRCLNLRDGIYAPAQELISQVGTSTSTTDFPIYKSHFYSYFQVKY